MKPKSFRSDLRLSHTTDVLLVRFLLVTVRKEIIRVEKVLWISGLQEQKAFDDLTHSVASIAAWLPHFQARWHVWELFQLSRRILVYLVI